MLRFFPLRSARRMSFVLSSLIALAGCAGSTGLTDPSLKDELLPAAPAAATGQCVAQIWDGRDGVVRPKWLRIVCPEARTPAFDLDLRRALAARGHGEDLPAAIADYQSAHGLPSDLLAYRTAQQLGLVPWIDEGI
ncbi:hypothetical protein [Paenirhodobacter enshiensis]|uniref:hypothetical protein n=1 Tax=Paenirhodobacter enshiensis TaxID=1105367 RepID=UPI0035B09969